MERGLTLGRPWGIGVRLDWSLVLVFGLVTYGLGASAFPSIHPGWGPALSWTVAGAATLLFFVSVFLHELALVPAAGRERSCEGAGLPGRGGRGLERTQSVTAVVTRVTGEVTRIRRTARKSASDAGTWSAEHTRLEGAIPT